MQKLIILLAIIFSSFGCCAQTMVDITDNWKVLRESDSTGKQPSLKKTSLALRRNKATGAKPPTGDVKWIDLNKTLTRQYRLANPYEPGQAIWLRNTFKISPALKKQKYLILSIANRNILGDVFVNGQLLPDVARTQ